MHLRIKVELLYNSMVVDSLDWTEIVNVLFTICWPSEGELKLSAGPEGGGGGWIVNNADATELLVMPLS